MPDRTYSVLMSVYAKEDAVNLAQSMESIFLQTAPTDDFVLVCDGPLTSELNKVIDEYQEQYPDILHVLRLERNEGLGNALNKGLMLCKNDLVARMDSDDLSYPDRCEKELGLFEAFPELDIVSGTIEEFTDDPEVITGSRSLPASYPEILHFSRKRNPFNHPAVMFRKEAVEKAGGYNERFHLFEDYYLWIRMLQKGCHGANLKDPILKMRTSESQMLRRGGYRYTKDMLAFHRWILRSGWSRPLDFLTGAVPHAVVCLLPNRLRLRIYQMLR
ncbi:MAG: glycosyltransferase [Lachnospiraceae bacterium]|nr:glycosyltransferase [Lachnospiraceae bacterium]